MSQEYILDGYNILNTVPELARLLNNSLKEARDQLKLEVELYCKTSSVSVTIVYDSQTMPNQFDEYEDGAQPLIVYTGANHTADEYIITRAEDAGNRSTTVVTDDRYIRESSVRSGCSVMQPAEFYEFILKQNKGRPGRPPSQYQQDQLDRSEVEEWLSIFNSDDEE